MANMISSPNGSVHVRCAPSPDVNRPIEVSKLSFQCALIRSSTMRNSSEIPSDVMIEGTMRLAIAE